VALREVLPQRRHCETFDMRFGNHAAPFNITVGHYPDGTPGEVFITGAKTGSEMAAITNDAAVLLSLAMQYGVPMTTIRSAIMRNADGTASSIVGAVIDTINKKET
jgi:hypothetical protein